MTVMRSFYRALGWPELPSSDDAWTGFLLSGVVLALCPLAAVAAEAATPLPVQGGWSGIVLACNVDSRDEVDRVFATALAAGATAVAEPTERSWGGRSAYVADPEGNRWEIAWATRAVFAERGGLVAFG